MKKKKTEKPQEEKAFEVPTARVIHIDTSVSLLMTSMPPGNPGAPWSPPDWGRPKW